MTISTVPVHAVVGFHYQGREIRPGEYVSMTPLDAAVAHRAGFVSLTRDAPGGRARPHPDPPPPGDAKRRRYRRRDLEPER